MKKQQKIEPGFLKDLRSALEVKHFTRRTKETYVYWITRYHTFLRSHRDLDKTPSKQKVEACLSNLAPNVAAATQNQAFNALLFFYRNVIGTELGDIHALRAKKKVRVPVILSKEETRKLLSCLTGYVALICRLMYGSGLRLEECLSLRIKDFDFEHKSIVVHAGKGDKDGIVQLPETLIGPLQEHMKGVKALHEYDLNNGFGRVMLPEGLERKYPGYQRNLDGNGYSPLPISQPI